MFFIPYVFTQASWPFHNLHVGTPNGCATSMDGVAFQSCWHLFIVQMIDFWELSFKKKKPKKKKHKGMHKSLYFVSFLFLLFSFLSDSNFANARKINTKSRRYYGSVWRKIFFSASNLSFLCCEKGCSSQRFSMYTCIFTMFPWHYKYLSTWKYSKYFLFTVLPFWWFKS